MTKGLHCSKCRSPMRLTTTAADRERYPNREWYRCERCQMSAYKDAGGAHYIPAARIRSPDPFAITAPIDPALEHRDGDWRRKHRRPKDA